MSTQKTTKEPKREKQPASKRATNYLNNADLLKEIIASKAKGQMTSKLAHMIILLVERYASKGNFASYTYNDEMQSQAILMLTRAWKSFDPEKSSNPFAYLTQVAKNSFIMHLNYEKKQQRVRDELLIEAGLNPSFNYRGDDDTDGVVDIYSNSFESHDSDEDHEDNESVKETDRARNSFGENTEADLHELDSFSPSYDDTNPSTNSRSTS